MEKKLKFLIVDDMATNRIKLSMTITSLGHLYECCSNGKEAIDLLQSKTFDIVLLDIEMPVMNGFETIKYIRDKTKEPVRSIPVIAITAHNPTEIQNDLNQLGFTSILSKPYSPDKFNEIFVVAGFKI